MLKDKLYKVWHNQNGEWGVEVLEDNYKGLIAHIKEISLDDVTNQLSVDYNILYKPDRLSHTDVNNNQTFDTFFGSLMNDVVTEAIAVYKSRNFGAWYAS